VASSLLTLLDDIATGLDDVAVMTKIATKKAVGGCPRLTRTRSLVLIPTVSFRWSGRWPRARCSTRRILVPAALLLSAFVPWVVIPLMIVGGAFLCFEGVEKLAHKLLHSTARDDARREILRTLADPNVDLIAFERDKITVEAATILEKPFTEAQLLASLRPLLHRRSPNEA
jgi:uncharacterized protein